VNFYLLERKNLIKLSGKDSIDRVKTES